MMRGKGAVEVVVLGIDRGHGMLCWAHRLRQPPTAGCIRMCVRALARARSLAQPLRCYLLPLEVHVECSTLAQVLDARTMTRLSKAMLPFRTPFLIHASYFPEDGMGAT